MNRPESLEYAIDLVMNTSSYNDSVAIECYVDNLEEQNKTMKSALENIKAHIEYIVGKTSKLSATWNIANDTLIKIKEGE